MRLLPWLLAACCIGGIAQTPEPPPDAVKPRDYKPAQENFMIGGVLPKDVPYRPLTNEQRWRLFVNQSFSLKGGAWFGYAFGAAQGHWRNRPAQWGQGARGYFSRVGDVVGRGTISNAIENGMDAMVGYDPRYARCKCEGAGRRLAHAFSWSFITYDRQGRKVFNYPKLTAAWASEAIGATWQPGTRWQVRGYQGMGEQLAFNAMFNIFAEFTPEVKKLLRRK